MPTIARLAGLEILDSRGRPTVRATCWLAGGASGTVSVPSGASTGSAEALELRDRDPARYGGLGCRTAVGNVNGALNDALAGKEFADQRALDQSYRNPSRFDHKRLFPGTSLEFQRPTLADVGGFAVCVGICVALLALAWWLANIGR